MHTRLPQQLHQQRRTRKKTRFSLFFPRDGHFIAFVLQALGSAAADLHAFGSGRSDDNVLNFGRKGRG
jgi:hypothetical protein